MTAHGQWETDCLKLAFELHVYNELIWVVLRVPVFCLSSSLFPQNQDFYHSLIIPYSPA